MTVIWTSTWLDSHVNTTSSSWAVGEKKKRKRNRKVFLFWSLFSAKLEFAFWNKVNLDQLKYIGLFACFPTIFLLDFFLFVICSTYCEHNVFDQSRSHAKAAWIPFRERKDQLVITWNFHFDQSQSEWRHSRTALVNSRTVHGKLTNIFCIHR